MTLVLMGYTKGNNQQVRDEYWVDRSSARMDSFLRLVHFVNEESYGPCRALVDLAMHGACEFFGTEEGERFRFIWQPMDRITTTLPIELQLSILDQLEIYQADKVVRETYSNLSDRWVSSLATRFADWFFALSSRDNMRFMDVIGGESTRIEIYRLRSVDLHPTIKLDEDYTTLARLPPGSPLQPPRQFSNVPALDDARQSLFDALYTLALHPRWLMKGSPILAKWQQEGDDHMMWREVEQHVHRELRGLAIDHPYFSRPYAGISLSQALRLVVQAGHVPFFIPLSVDPSEDKDRPGKVRGDGSDGDDDMSDSAGAAGSGNNANDNSPLEPFVKGTSFLLLYPDEIEPMIRNFEVIMRPDKTVPCRNVRYKVRWFVRFGMLAQCFIKDGAALSARGRPPHDRTPNALFGDLMEDWEDDRRNRRWRTL